MTSIHLDENDIDSVLAALPTGTVRETVFAHCRCITSSGRDIRDNAEVLGVKVAENLIAQGARELLVEGNDQ